MKYKLGSYIIYIIHTCTLLVPLKFLIKYKQKATFTGTEPSFNFLHKEIEQ